jgi:hypothetical protein
LILIISSKQADQAILDALHGSFAQAREDAVGLRFDPAGRLTWFKYTLRAAVDVTRMVYVNTAADHAVANFANQNSLPLVLVSTYSLLGEDDRGDFLRSAAGYIEGIVRQHFIIGQGQFEHADFTAVADQITGLSNNGLFGRYHARIAEGGAALEQVSRKDASPYITRRLDRAGLDR